jgi:DNA mismatch repair protein MSH6
VTYCGSDKKRFQLEVPDNFTNKAGKHYELQGQRKGFKKYWTSETKASRLLVFYLFVSVAEMVWH